MTPIVAAALAGFGWWFITQLARQREVQEQYTSIVGLLRTLDAEGRAAWISSRKGILSEHTEISLLLKLVEVEGRFKLIEQHYGSAKSKAIKPELISMLRRALTGEQRNGEISGKLVSISHFTSDVTSKAIDASIDYVKSQRRRTAFAGVAAVVVIAALSLPLDRWADLVTELDRSLSPVTGAQQVPQAQR